MLALINNGAILQEVLEDSRVILPGNKPVSPTYDGWGNSEGYFLRSIVDPGVPEGKVSTSRKLSLIEGVPTVSYDLEDAPVEYRPLTKYEFWDAAYDALGLKKTDVLSDIDVALAAETISEDEHYKMLLAINEASQFDRADPFVASLAAMQNITDEQLDSLWLWASGA
jgi:hypothetical protein